MQGKNCCYHLGPALTLAVAKSILPKVNGTVSRELSMTKLLFYPLGPALTLTVAKSNLPTVNGTVSQELCVAKTVVLFITHPRSSQIYKSNLPSVYRPVSREVCMGEGVKLSFHFLELPKPNLPRVNETVSKIIADGCHSTYSTVWSM
jgi:hypothetical protein